MRSCLSTKTLPEKVSERIALDEVQNQIFSMYLQRTYRKYTQQHSCGLRAGLYEKKDGYSDVEWVWPEAVT